MNTKLLLGAAALVLSASAHAETAMFSGQVGANAGARICFNTDDDNCYGHGVSAVDGSIRFAFGPFSAQADVSYETYAGMNDASSQTEGAGAAGLHLAYRTETDLFGVFFSQQSMMIGDRTEKGDAYGFEYQRYSDALTWYGTAGYSDIEYDGTDNSFQGGYLIGELRYFPSDHTRLSASLGLGRSPNGYEDDGDYGETVSFAASLTRRFGESSFYWSVGLERVGYVANTEDEGSELRTTFGVSWLFGADSLKQADREGATLRTALLPARAGAWAETLD